MSRRNGRHHAPKAKVSQSLRVSLAQLEAEAREAARPAPEVRWVGTRDTCKNKLERDYYDHLTHLRQAGEIHDFRYEACSFRLGDGCFYMPDFLVLHADGRLTIDETKGRMFAHSLVKLKVFATLYPFFALRLVERTKHDRFEITPYRPITLL